MQTILSIGSNIGNKKKNIENAIYLLHNNYNITMLNVSNFYETEPFGYKNQNWFLNIVLIADTDLSPHNLLIACKKIEANLGRKQTTKWAERTIDIDILMYSDMILDTADLTIPHQYMHLRNFVLIPLNSIAPDTIHPIFSKTISQLLIECPDTSAVKLVKN
ncbi:MAG: 2-amino-4-hydroxy-6-hydroxymethyldihydropteridine diphosphokinase [Bacteroidetes bacterium]|nr:2-amino-4-hydroxy-6-hydroxymethyldihydropteridine diphosphokinase [Bacteroidota bacterium]